MYQRIGAAAYKPDLKNTLQLCALGNDPHLNLRCIHVAGTNGKGSTSHYLASILQEAGYKTGLYTSPHLKDFRERISINGKLISKKYIVDFVEQYKNDFSKINPSFFEMTVFMAFKYFDDKKVDVAVIETGLGGRLDSTNVIYPDLSVITNISFDHMHLLGDSLEKIAAEKAGIIKEHIPVVVGEAKGKIRKLFKKEASEKHSDIYFADTINTATYFKSELKGVYQQKNKNTVYLACKILQQRDYKISPAQIKKGIAKVVTNTGLRGRWETIGTYPKIICDIGHNEAGIHEVVKQLKKEKYKQLHIVIGTVNDKDVSKMLKQLPRNAHYYYTSANMPRALDALVLKGIGEKLGLKGEVYLSVKRALKAAKKNAGKQDLIFVGGSAFIVAEAL